MPDERRHESADLEDYEVLDSSDTLDEAPGDDPLDRGVAPPERWSAGMRYGTTEAEQTAGESLDQHLAEEEPDSGAEPAADDSTDDGVDPRSGRLRTVEADQPEGTYRDTEPDMVAADAGPDGGGATAEEAAMHTVDREDHDIRPE